MSERSCKTCRHWHNDAKDNYGLCKRYPPQVQMIMMHEKFTNKPVAKQSLYCPITKEMDWCGEWNFKAPPPPGESMHDDTEKYYRA